MPFIKLPDDLAGIQLGRLTVLRRAARAGSGAARWLCRCACGVERPISRHGLVHGTSSCGCLNREVNRERGRHHECATRLYRTWANMRQRCLNPNRRDFHNYGGRGIAICSEWGDFIAFREWAVANGYRDDLTIERIDCNGNYEPGNCTWIPRSEQPRNTRIVLRAPNGRLWADIAGANGVNRWTMGSRLRAGWPAERAASEPPIRQPEGEAHHNARLTAADVAAIRAGSETTRAMAERFGVSRRHVRKIRSGGRWAGALAHVEA